MKIFKKIIGLFLGAVMALGVGFAISSNSSKAIPVHAATSSATVEFGTNSGRSSSSPFLFGSIATLTGTVATTTKTNVGFTGTFTFTPASGKKITEIQITSTSTAQYKPGGSYVVDGSANSVSFDTIVGTYSNLNALTSVAFTVNSAARLTTATVTVDDATTPVKTLESIAITGDLTTKSYTTAESWSFEGLTVTGTYSDSSTDNLTSSAIFTVYESTGTTIKATPNDLGAGINQTIQVMATVSSINSVKVSITGINIEAVSLILFDATVDKDLDNTTQGSGSITKNSITYSCNDGILGNGSEYRMYKNSSTTISISSGSITQVEFIGKSGNPASGFASQTGWTTDGYNGTWVGSAASVTFIASGAQVRATKINVTYSNDTPTPVSGHSIIFNENAGGDTVTNMPSTLTNKSGTVSLEDLSSPSRSGYTFTGWSLSASGAVVTSVTVDDSDVEVFAIWEEIVEEYHLDYTAGSHGLNCTVNGHAGIKFGTGSADGDMTITIPSGVTKIKLYIAAWKGYAGTVTLSGAATETLSATADDGISGNSLSFTLSGTESTFKHEITVTSGTLTIASGSAHRFVVWGATDLFAESYASEFMTKITCNSAGTSEPTYASGYNWLSFRSIYNNLDAEEKGRLVSPDNQTLIDCIARYDYIVGKYNPTGETDSTKTNYAHYITGRIVTPLGSARILLSNIINVNTNAAIIIVISLISITAIGAYVFIRKKREN